jgi:hypothetical protein
MKNHLLVPVLYGFIIVNQGCTVVGPPSISNGRMAYNEVINYTEDQQLLNAIVRERYGQTFGMLSVASVAANVKFRGDTNFLLVGGGNDELALGAAYEENPTITYVPVQGEAVIGGLVNPLSLEETLAIRNAGRNSEITWPFLFRRWNDIQIPFDQPWSPDLVRAIEISNVLQESGCVGLGRLSEANNSAGEYAFVISGYSKAQQSIIREYFDLIGIKGKVVDGRDIIVSFGLSVDPDAEDKIYIETRSILDWLRLAGDMVDVPDEHLTAGIVDPPVWGGKEGNRLITIHSSRSRPKNAVVSILFRGYWFYIDETDSTSKESFKLLKFTVGLRLNPENILKQAPVLTLPVG